jgi:hypothetical protein
MLEINPNGCEEKLIQTKNAIGKLCNKAVVRYFDKDVNIIV